MRRRPVAPEQAGGAENQRPCADRGDVLGTFGLSAQELQHLFIANHVVGARAAGNTDHVELRAIGESGSRHQRQHGVGFDRLDPLPQKMHRRARHAREHLQGAGKVKLGNSRKHQKSDLKRRR